MIRRDDSHLIIRFTQSSETGSVQLTLTIHFKSGCFILSFLDFCYFRYSS
jgi:hypothetical protein